jgi:hypothetical protein
MASQLEVDRTSEATLETLILPLHAINSGAATTSIETVATEGEGLLVAQSSLLVLAQVQDLQFCLALLLILHMRHTIVRSSSSSIFLNLNVLFTAYRDPRGYGYPPMDYPYYPPAAADPYGYPTSAPLPYPYERAGYYPAPPPGVGGPRGERSRTLLFELAEDQFHRRTIISTAT